MQDIIQFDIQREIKEDKQNWWNDLSELNRKEVLSLPNFDKDIFKEITGIDVETVETVK